MINFTIFSTNLVPIVCFALFESENLILFAAILFVVIASAVIYIIAYKYKKNFAYKRDALLMKINLLKQNNETLKKEIENLSKERTILQSKLREGEKEWSNWLEEKKKLEQENIDLKNQLLNFKKNGDIIIEYYMNDKSEE
jgi:hypothetical protein